MQLRDYQEQAVTFLYEHDRALVLASVGAGKTAIALTAMKEMVENGIAKRWLVLAPKRVCTDVWMQEKVKWNSPLSMAIAIGTPQKRLDAFMSKVDVVVFGYDNLQALPHLNFDGIVFDELSRLKNPSGKRYKALLKQIDAIKFRWGLTGSFTSNGLEDVFGQSKIVDQSLLGRSKGAFLQQYFNCDNREYGQWSPRPDALPQVMDRIRPATFVLEAKEYKDKLPPLHTVEIRCDMPDRKAYEAMKKDFVAQFGDTQITALNAAVVTSKLHQLSAGFCYDSSSVASNIPGKFIITRTPVWNSTHKFDRLDELLEENQHDPTLIFYAFDEEKQELLRRYPHAQTLDDTNATERWNRGEIEILIAHPKSASHGLNLQGYANKIVFLSLPWSAELYEQAIGRIHRQGQKREVWCYIMITNNSIDEKIWAALHDKQAVSDIAMKELRNVN